MTNLEKYNNIMMANLKVTEDQLPGLKYRGIPTWDSMAHMDMINDLEEAFKIRMETIDILNYTTYERGKEILGSYGVSFE